MKKNYILFLFLLFPFIMNGQSFLKYGGIVSMNYSSITSDHFDASPIIGFGAGIFRNFTLGDNFDLVNEVGFTQKGGKVFSGEEEYKIRSNSFYYAAIGNYYLSAPNFSIQAGPILIIERTTMDTNGLEQIVLDGPTGTHLDNLIFRLGQSTQVGLTAGISGGTEFVRVNLRYIYDLTNRKLNISGSETAKLPYLQLSVSFFIPQL